MCSRNLNTITCLCSRERYTKVDCGVALRCSPLPIKVRWPFLEQDHAWLLGSLPISTAATPSPAPSLSSLVMQGCRWTPSYCSAGAVRHSPLCWLLRAWLSGSQLHSCTGEYGMHSPRDTLPPQVPSCTCRHLPISLFWIFKLDASVEKVVQNKLSYIF